MKIWIFILIAFLSFLSECDTGLLRVYASFIISSLVGFILFYILTVFSLKKFNGKLKDLFIFISLLLGLCLIQIGIRINGFQSTLISFPDFIMHLLGIISAYVYFKTRAVIGISISLLCLGFTLYMFFDGYDLWINKLDYGTFTGLISEKAPKFSLTADSSVILNNETVKYKILVLDFWTTACGVCFRKFPKLQKQYEKYRERRDILFYSVNLHLERDSINQAVNTIRELKYTFPVIVVDNDTITEQLGFSGVPTVIIIRDGSELIFRGDIEDIDKVLEQ